MAAVDHVGVGPEDAAPAIPAPGPTRWNNVARAVYEVEQSYRYTYSEQVSRMSQRLVLVPPDVHGTQRLLGYGTSVQGTADDAVNTWHTDSYGNRVWAVQAKSVPRSVTFGVRYRVERENWNLVHNSWVEEHDPGALDPFLEPTPLTMPDARFEEAAARLHQLSPIPGIRAYRAFHWTAAAISYRTGVTEVQTTASGALNGGIGVCQDFAHIMLTVLRLMDIPARYVSGHLLGRGAPHAWVEALLPEAPGSCSVRVVAYDPSNRAEPGLNYIAVAVGRDFADVSPTSGTYFGSASSTLTFEKNADVVEVEYGRERRTSSIRVAPAVVSE